MKYMLLIYGVEDSWTDAERDACIAKSVEIVEELVAQGKCLSASPLHPVSAATSVRLRGGKRQITDGPFAETTEQLGGYYLLDVENLDEAIAIASRLPPAEKGTVEIRPLFPLPTPPAKVGMPTFRREVRIAATATAVYRALTTQEGIEGWWTNTCTVSESLGGETTVRFAKCFKTMRNEQLIPNSLVRWRCIAAHIETDTVFNNPAEWVGTTIEFHLHAKDPGTTIVTVEHVGLGPRFECYDLCVNGWNHFIASLKQYAETGVGTPFDGSTVPAHSA